MKKSRREVINLVFYKIWDCFSLQKNLSSLLKIDTRSRELACLDGLRVLSQFVVVWCHVVVDGFNLKYPALNKFSYYEMLKDLFYTPNNSKCSTVYLCDEFLCGIKSSKDLSATGERKRLDALNLQAHYETIRLRTYRATVCSED
ncbi:unnamed protein product [Nezara viridula]|uniref:Uncharacterized protein n=1 Tax=Nezara viridula TaxID=85310 RepID=A0A9P0EG02_NEZVI|nr:unnamed protein product [Nezara viridula]